MRLAPEVDVFDQQVGGEEQIFGCAAGMEDGAIVADAEGQARCAPRWNAGADSFDELKLALHTRGGSWRQKFTIDANDAGSRLAPPTSTPSISGCAIRARALSGFTLPP